MSRSVIHLSTMHPNRFGGFTTGTACNRETLQSDAKGGGNNSTDVWEDVTCKLCKKPWNKPKDAK